MYILLLLIAIYVVLVHARNHISLPGRLGIVIGGLGGFLLGAWLMQLGIEFPLLPLIYAVAFGLFLGARWHALFMDSFKK